MKKRVNRLNCVRSKFKLILALMSILLPASFFAAQEVQEFTGCVTDPKGAVVPNATVTALDLDSGVNTHTTTTHTGDYTIPYVTRVITLYPSKRAASRLRCTSDLFWRWIRSRR